MAFNLTNSEREEMFTGMIIPATIANSIASALYTTKTGIDAKVLTVPGIGEVTVNDLTSAGMTVDFLGDAVVDVPLDQIKYVNAAIERYDDFNSFLDASGSLVADKAANEMAKVADIYAFAQLAVDAGVTVPTIALDETNVLEWIGDMQVSLDEAEAPEYGRGLAVDAKTSSLIARALKDSGSDMIATEAGKNGFVMNYANFNIYKTNHLAAGATTGKFAIATVQSANALGIGWNEVRVKELEAFFADAFQAATAYGAKVIKPEWVVKCDVTQA